MRFLQSHLPVLDSTIAVVTENRERIIWERSATTYQQQQKVLLSSLKDFV
jgi:hypothetical protein